MILVEFGFHAVRVMDAARWSGVPLVVHFWGTSDITKLNHYIDQFAVFLPGEPFWWILAPFIKILPYRMAAIHGLVATCFSALVISLFLLDSPHQREKQ